MKPYKIKDKLELDKMVKLPKIVHALVQKKRNELREKGVQISMAKIISNLIINNIENDTDILCDKNAPD